MDSRKPEEGRPTIDYHSYEEFADQDYMQRFSLHSLSGMNPMANEPNENQDYDDLNQDDKGHYYQYEVKQDASKLRHMNSNPRDYSSRKLSFYFFKL